MSTFPRHSDQTATRPAPQISEERRQTVGTARRSWIRKLIDLSRRNNLLYFRPLKTGTLELTASSSERLRDLLVGESDASLQVQMPLAPQSKWPQLFGSKRMHTVICHLRSHTTTRHEHLPRIKTWTAEPCL